MARLCLVTNHPMPYRVFLFNRLEEELRSRGHSLFVYFFDYGGAAAAHGVAPESFRFDSAILPGLVWQHGTRHAALCRAKSRRFRDFRWLLVGGYYSPALVSLALAPSPAGQKRLLWVETHHQSSTTPQRWRRLVKTFLFNRQQAFVVPGQWAEEYVRSLRTRPSAARFLRLPNLVDEDRFGAEVRAARQSPPSPKVRLGLDRGRRLVLCVARLVPLKGLMEFLASLVPEDFEKADLVLAGDGPLRGDIEALVREKGLSSRVKIAGFEPNDQIVKWLAAADAFLLPSIHDCSPLAVVEALFAGLPLLLSNRVGNHPEALRPSRNGFLFDPFDAGSIRGAWRSLLALPDDRLRDMGAESQRLAEATFSSRTVIPRFVSELESL